MMTNSIKPNVLVTGASGQLGSSLRRLADGAQGCFWFTDVDQLDITNEKAVAEFFERHTVDVVVNCAAYTAVDKAEQDATVAHSLNCTAVEVLARVAHRHKAAMIHISTDYVFDGEATRPYREDDVPSPRSVYGQTKLEGERVLAASGVQYIILRTAWLYSEYGHNFVKTILRAAHEKPVLKVVSDQIGSPTYAGDLAAAILHIVDRRAWVGNGGVYHYSDEGVCSWYDFATAIVARSGVENCRVEACSSDEYPSPVHRPAYSVLDKSRVKAAFGLDIPQWQESLCRCLSQMK